MESSHADSKRFGRNSACGTINYPLSTLNYQLTTAPCLGENRKTKMPLIDYGKVKIQGKYPNRPFSATFYHKRYVTPFMDGN
ncbi:MAG: hypothetical protein LBC20_08450 [Planctomycetaceae bacterium]|nr:hypothetical protein [Planctomycetaceae bacterium]